MPLPSIIDLIKRGSVFENNIDELLERAEDDFERTQRVANILSWLQVCVDHGKYLPQLTPDRRTLQGQVDYWTSILGQNGIDVEIDRLAPFDPTAGVPLEVDCPYPGLKAYDENRKDDFLGRTKDTEDCVAHFEESRILMIVGGSGSGKSSLALAGVLSKLKSDHEDWQLVPYFTPGAKPFESLGKALAIAFEKPSDYSTIAKSLRQQPEQASAVFDELFGAAKPVMLLIDQFEELLTLCPDEQEQKAFSKLLYGLVTQPESACRILLTLRTDHLARFENNLQDLYRLVSNKNTRQLTAIDFEGIRQAIETPAKNIGLRFLPPTIIDKLASQSASLVDGLPLLQFALQRLWEERPTARPRNDENGNKIEEKLPQLDYINEESFEKLPDVQSALGKVAEDVFQLFDEEKKKLCERLMLELVLMDENFEQPLRRRRSKAELLDILVQRWPETTANEVIDDFVKQGLLRYSGDEDRQLEVAHEAMFRNWPTFRVWISGESAKTRLHAVKLIGREALDWRAHEKEKNSSDYLKLAGEPLKLAQEYVKESWLDKDSTAYVNTCYLQEQEKEAQRLQAEKAKDLALQAEIARIQAEKEQAKAEAEKLEALRQIEIAGANAKAQDAEIARIQAEKEQAKAEAENLEARRKIEVAEANAKARKRLALSGLASVIIAALAVLWTYNEGQKKAVLTSLPLLTSKLPPWEALDVANSVAQKGGEDFRYELAHALEAMEDRYLFSPRESIVQIAGQGTAIFQFDKSEQDNQKLKVFRVCQDGRIDNNFAEIDYQGRQLSAQLVDIAPPNDQAGKNDNRLLILPFKKEPGWDVEVHQLNWQNGPCADVIESEKDPKKRATLLDSARKSLDDVDEISAIAFDANGINVAFSAISRPGPEKKESKVWILNRSEGNWKSVSTELKLPDNNEKSVSTEPKLRDNNENVVSAVAFTEGDPNLPPEQRLITGRFNGALYCRDKPLGKNLDKSPVLQISTNHSKFENDRENWFVYLHESGKVVAGQCSIPMQVEKPSTDGDQGNITSVSMNYIPTGINRHVNPVVTIVNDMQQNCWIKNDEKWISLDCSSARFVKQFAIAPDAKHIVEVDVGGMSVDEFPQEFLAEDQKQWIGRLSGKNMVVWPKKALGGSGDTSKTSWLKSAEPLDFNRFVAQLSPGVEIIKAVISTTGNYIAWLERKDTGGKIDLGIFDIKKGDNIKFKAIEGLQKLDKANSKTITNLAVTDEGSIALAIDNEFRLFDLSGGKLEKVDLPSDQTERANISCIGLSPNNEKLVIGTHGGGLRLINLSKRPIEPTQTVFRNLSNGTSKDFASACAVDNKGMMVGGFSNSSVRVAGTDGSVFQLVSPLAGYQFKVPVKAVSIDSQRGHVAALFRWQTSGCTANGLPGQFIRIWGNLEEKEESPLISNICLPNRRVITIGSIEEQDKKLLLPVAFDDGIELKPCRGCANKNEKPKDVLGRLFKEANNFNQVNNKCAQPTISDEKLEKRYGIKFWRSINSFKDFISCSLS